MIRVVIAELRKLRRPSLLLGTIATVGGLSALFTSIVFLMIDSEEGNSKRGESIGPEELSEALGLVYGFKLVGVFLGVVALCIFASQTAQEYSLGTLRNLLVRQPSRMKILAGKFIAMKLFALVMVLFAGALSIAISYALAGRAKVDTTAWGTSAAMHILFESALNIFLATLCFGTFGMILGLLFRSPISAIAVGVLWNLILENILAALINSTVKWLPGINFANLGEGGNPDLTYKHSIAISLSYLIIGGAIAAILFKKRDVAN
jgi:ABC-type transport system involved in multi-copper enzyme maturation permease subunit